MSELSDLVALSLLPVRWWPETCTRLRAGEPPGALLDRIVAERRPDQVERGAVVRARAEAALVRGHAQGLLPIGWSDPRYPAALAAIIDPPPVLWLRGVVAALERTPVAIVGARAASPYAIAVAERLAADLAAHGLTIVSGLARGVDSAAHRGALSVGGATVAVLGSGADVIYPPEHGPLARAISETGVVLSELVPGTPPRPRFFPQRNRVIAGLSRAVVVIEAGERSGSLITARSALDQGRDVLAVPGNVLSGRNRGGHALLRDGAKIVETADDILEELGLRATDSRHRDRQPDRASDPLLARLTPGEPCNLDALAERTGLSPAQLLPRLLELEMQGSVRRVGGGRFVRIDSSC